VFNYSLPGKLAPSGLVIIVTGFNMCHAHLKKIFNLGFNIFHGSKLKKKCFLAAFGFVIKKRFLCEIENSNSD
jgi:hypothetical protein